MLIFNKLMQINVVYTNKSKYYGIYDEYVVFFFFYNKIVIVLI